jgi:hypothetical protein
MRTPKRSKQNTIGVEYLSAAAHQRRRGPEAEKRWFGGGEVGGGAAARGTMDYSKKKMNSSGYTRFTVSFF